MNKVTDKLQVFFEEPFWIGIFERVEDEKLAVCKVTFGAEPKDYEVLEFILKNFDKLKFSPTIETNIQVKERINPKRLQRAVKKQVQELGIGTKSQQALQLLHEQNKMERKSRSNEQKDLEKQHQFDLKQQKRKEKHKGR
jgi:hypothetical protein